MPLLRAPDGTVRCYCVCNKLLCVVHADGTIEIRASCGVESAGGQTYVTCRCGAMRRRVGKTWA